MFKVHRSLVILSIPHYDKKRSDENYNKQGECREPDDEHQCSRNIHYDMILREFSWSLGGIRPSIYFCQPAVKIMDTRNIHEL